MEPDDLLAAFDEGDWVTANTWEDEDGEGGGPVTGPLSKALVPAFMSEPFYNYFVMCLLIENGTEVAKEIDPSSVRKAPSGAPQSFISAFGPVPKRDEV